MTTPTRLQCQSHIWITPAEILDPVRAYFGGPIPLDPATEPDNPAGAELFYTDGGLEKPWPFPTFVNPPCGEVFPDWCAKISAEAGLEPTTPILALLPCGARFGTGYFQRFLATPELKAVCWIGRRVPFLRPVDEGDGALFRHYETGSGNLYDSALYGLNVDWPRFKTCFEGLGVCWRVNT